MSSLVIHTKDGKTYRTVDTYGHNDYDTASDVFDFRLKSEKWVEVFYGETNEIGSLNLSSVEVTYVSLY
jgi:hypothetical protein